MHRQGVLLFAVVLFVLRMLPVPVTRFLLFLAVWCYFALLVPTPVSTRLLIVLTVFFAAFLFVVVTMPLPASPQVRDC